MTAFRTYTPAQQKDFKRRLAVGARFQRLVAEKLRAAGLDVLESRPSFCTDPSKIPSYTRNETDLIAEGLPLEIKSSRATFTGPEDFPFSHAILETVSGFHGKTTPPYAYILVSQPTQAALVFYSRHRPLWVKRPITDRARDTTCLSYLAPLALAHPLKDLVDRLSAAKIRF